MQVPLRVSGEAVEGAEAAPDPADVRVVHVAADDVGDAVARDPGVRGDVLDHGSRPEVHVDDPGGRFRPDASCRAGQ